MLYTLYDLCCHRVISPTAQSFLRKPAERRGLKRRKQSSVTPFFRLLVLETGSVRRYTLLVNYEMELPLGHFTSGIHEIVELCAWVHVCERELRTFQEAYDDEYG